MKMVKILLLMMACFLSNCSKAQQAATGKKILIVYLSRTNNTRAVAQIIHKQIGGAIIPIEPANAYPADYKTTVEQVARENESGFLPPLKTRIDSIENYDVVFIGFPTWGMQLPPPMKSFIRQYNLSGKTIIPFNTHAGYGVGTGFQQVKNLCSGSKVLEGYSVKGGVERDGQLFVMEGKKLHSVEKDIELWLKRIKVIE